MAQEPQSSTIKQLTTQVRHLGVLVEAMMSQNNVVLENVLSMQNQITSLLPLVDDVAELKSDVRLIKLAVTETNKDVRNHEVRITALEASRP